MALVAAVAAAFGAFALLGPHSPEALRGGVAGAGLLAPLIFVAVWVLLTPAMGPGTLLAAAGGLLFGLGPGSVLSLLGATLGGLASFAIARVTCNDALAGIGGERLAKLKARIERRGFVPVLLARLAPGVPSTALNYACGLTRVRARDFVAAIALGGAPRVVSYTALGSSGGDPTSLGGILGIGLSVAIALAALAVIVVRRVRARRALALAA